MNPNRIRVLVVDDHPVLREGVAVLVSQQPDPLMVGEASTGREALEQFRSTQPDVTLMDIKMPDMSGIDAIIAIREEYPDARINSNRSIAIRLQINEGTAKTHVKNILAKLRANDRTHAVTLALRRGIQL
jgi:DNA-binding NarL/FixJ family response regulator